MGQTKITIGGLPQPVFTGARLIMEERSGSKRPAIACWADGSGGLFKVITITFHFENGTWFSERTLPGTWDGSGTWEETDTDYDPDFNGGTDGSGYGNAIPPYESYEYSDEVTQSDVEAEVSSMSPTWGSWTGTAAINTNVPSEAFEHADGSTFNASTGDTSYTITKTDNTEAGFGGLAADVTLVQARFKVVCPLAVRVFYQSGPSAATSELLSPGSVWTAPDPDVAIDENHAVTVSALQWLPWP
jgi:hypothetical protein